MPVNYVLTNQFKRRKLDRELRALGIGTDVVPHINPPHSEPKKLSNLNLCELQLFNRLIEIQLDNEWVVDWDHTANGWTFVLKGASLVISHDDIRPTHVVTSSSSMWPEHLIPMRKRMSEMLAQSAYRVKSFRDVSKLLGQIVQEAVSRVKSFQWMYDIESDLLFEKGWNARKVKDWRANIDNSRGVDISTLENDDTVRDLLGRSMQEIYSVLPRGVRVLHIETVLRHAILARFLKRRDQLTQKLLQFEYAQLRERVDPKVIPHGSANDNLEGLVAHMCKPVVAYHGTLHNRISSIVRYGFVKPGDLVNNQRLVHVSDIGWWGRGIYTTPAPSLAEMFVRLVSNPSDTDPGSIQGYRMIVCAVLLGFPVTVHDGEAKGRDTLLEEYADSHLADTEEEYVVFDADQILPCYVVVWDEGVGFAKRYVEDVHDRTVSAKRKRRYDEWIPEGRRRYWFDAYQDFRFTDEPVDFVQGPGAENTDSNSSSNSGGGGGGGSNDEPDSNNSSSINGASNGDDRSDADANSPTPSETVQPASTPQLHTPLPEEENFCTYDDLSSDPSQDCLSLTCQVCIYRHRLSPFLSIEELDDLISATQNRTLPLMCDWARHPERGWEDYPDLDSDDGSLIGIAGKEPSEFMDIEELNRRVEGARGMGVQRHAYFWERFE